MRGVYPAEQLENGRAARRRLRFADAVEERFLVATVDDHVRPPA